MLAQLVSFASIAPDHLAYFNSLFGGPSRGYQKLVDSNLDWGQDLPRRSSWLRAHGTNRVRLAYFGSALPLAYGIDATPFKSSDQRSGGPEYVAISVTFLQGAFVCGDPFGPFRSFEPSARAGYSIMVYATARPEVQAALAVAQADPCTP